MKLPGIFCLLVLFLIGLNAQAQIPNEWHINGLKVYSLLRYCGSDNVIIEEKNRGFGGQFSIHDSNGKIKYNLSWDSCYDKNGNYLKNSRFRKDLGDYRGSMSSSCLFHVIACPTKIKPYQYYVFNSFPTKVPYYKDTTFNHIRLAYRILDDTVNNNRGGFSSESYYLVSNKPLINQIIVPFENLKGYWLIAKGIKYYYIFRIDSKGINLHDSLSSGNENCHLPIDCYISSSGKRLLSYNRKNVNALKFYREDLELTLYNFDNINGKLSYNKTIDMLKFYNEIFYPTASPGGFSFSPNDSLLYINFINYDKYFLNISDKTMVQLDLYNNKRYYWIDSTYGIQAYTPQYSRMSNDGKLNFGWANSSVLYRDQSYYLSQIHNPNVFGKGCNFQDKVQLISNKDLIFHSAFSNFLSLYRPSSIKAIKNCKGAVTFYSFLDSFYKNGILTIDNKVVYTSKQNLDSFKTQLKPGKHYYKLTAVSGDYPDVCLLDSIEIFAPPKAYFSTTDTIGCQWLGFKFNDQSVSPVKTSSYLSYWYFGDGHDTLISGKTLPLKSPTHIYTQAGDYKISLIFNNGQCKDTLTLSKKVKILEAPQPGFTYNPEKICSPQVVTFKNSYLANLDSVKWDFGNGESKVSKKEEVKTNYLNDGNFNVTQSLYGPTGCITQSIKTIALIKGFDSTYHPTLIAATLLEDERPQISWLRVPLAKHYLIFKDRVMDGSVIDTFYNDKNSEKGTFSFQIKAVDQCNRYSGLSNTGKTILLKGSNIENKYSTLSWTGYEQWPGGVKSYTIQSFNAVQGIWDNLITINGKSSDYRDEMFMAEGQLEKCYRVIAFGNNMPGEISSSNAMCLNYLPKLFVPNAFSPNGDGLNDEFSLATFGLINFKLIIFNRWGEKVFESENQNDNWDGSYLGNIPKLGEIFYYAVKAQDRNGKHYAQQGTLEIIR